MIDPLVQRLLEQVLDTPTKLHMLLMFHEHPRCELTAAAIAERLFRDIWSVEQALEDLTAAGFLSVAQVTGGQPVYRYTPPPEWHEAIRRLVRSYNDPIERDMIQRTIRDLSVYASFRRSELERFEFV
ncbi:MAG TPA: hypothetical protein DEF43_10090 [Chloroflexus aurantiacus]|jgi:predicted transcriptional regulator|uniref:Uncharacterized protein n=1 Tax=Chloroflexus aurantiacus (strain ATCC 29366 / DSM 635 / J-10-fl) TaxID=324602 RepID=A9WC78_CHLAA|nr:MULTISPECIES: hypothetical protein [Chloroflexus]ABY33471.1 conserved hypothetical protein [Chloroflexus aurantiacus J-10-fl]RMG47139.1 MAG: hypothetical protein D6716_16035 [Chloroflexota bacterium]GIV92844.1 MAG: hypothetical protein KatS3mg056_1553 [Chloroflexus sp.]HBW67490.1 hypothetical protein [Chloroflexus aurantiacus]